MITPFKYDLFISYATSDCDIANLVVNRIEARGKKCFIAPRDISGGSEYAVEIVSAISNSAAMLLIFSEESDKSFYVLREVNSAVSRNKTIIPLRIENFLPSEAMEFYLGPTHWLNAFPEILDTHLDNILSVLNGIVSAKQKQDFSIKGPECIDNNRLFELGYSKEKITMREIELDYLCVDPKQFCMNDAIEGTFEDWVSTTQNFADTGCCIIEKDAIVGYTYLLPLTDDDYNSVISGEKMITADMIDLYELGGEYNAYISMIAVDPTKENQEYYLMIFKWIFERIEHWKAKDIVINNIGVSVYSGLLKKFLTRFGFKFTCKNLAGGEIYECSVEELRNNSIAKKFF